MNQENKNKKTADIKKENLATETIRKQFFSGQIIFK